MHKFLVKSDTFTGKYERVSFLSVLGIEVSRLEDIDGLGHVNLQNNPISDDLKSQLQSCKFTVLLGNDAVS